MKGHGQGRTKGPPAPHLAAKGAGQHLHDKAKPCQFGLAPRGDCPPPLKWAAGRPTGRGLQGHRHFPPSCPGSGVQQGQDPRDRTRGHQSHPVPGTGAGAPAPTARSTLSTPTHPAHGTRCTLHAHGACGIARAHSPTLCNKCLARRALHTLH